ncbi:MAG: hypothetical protein IPK79_06535 [Vampirovibrionales bacterium]|nr:hypothetical protein [Vampirovibrionales bacterium]
MNLPSVSLGMRFGSLSVIENRGAVIQKRYLMPVQGSLDRAGWDVQMILGGGVNKPDFKAVLSREGKPAGELSFSRPEITPGHRALLNRGHALDFVSAVHGFMDSYDCRQPHIYG